MRSRAKMQFKENKGIYLQIAETLVDRLLSSSPAADEEGEERFPAIRETAFEFGVNPNTVTRSYAFLQEQGIIRNQRGIGYFVAPEGREQILNWKKESFLREVLPEVFTTMDLLGLSLKDLRREYEQYQQGADK
jgi:DNA-binding transcriptional regulator YhcF (GntR family)